MASQIASVSLKESCKIPAGQDVYKRQLSQLSGLKLAYIVDKMPRFIGVKCGVKFTKREVPAIRPKRVSISGVWR